MPYQPTSGRVGSRLSDTPLAVIRQLTLGSSAEYQTRQGSAIYTTIGEACVCVCAKFDQFLPVRPHLDTKRPVNFFT